MPGTYDLRVKGMHTLTNRWSDLTLVAGDNIVDLGELLEGDADNDVDGTDASLVSRFTFDASRSTFHASRFTSPVTITFSPASITAKVDDVFIMDAVIQAGAQLVDTVEAYIYFPASVLQVVDAGGYPATTVEGGTAFDMELANSADNSAGKIHYAATMLGSSLAGDINVATIRFRAIAPTSRGWLRFQVWPPEKTDVTYLGQSVLTAWPAASVIVEGYPKIYLPLILKEAS